MSGDCLLTKWQVDWFDGVHQMGVTPLSKAKEK